MLWLEAGGLTHLDDGDEEEEEGEAGADEEEGDEDDEEEEDELESDDDGLGTKVLLQDGFDDGGTAGG